MGESSFMPEVREDKDVESEKDKIPNVFFTRHSKAAYETNKAILRSEDPTQALDTKGQVVPDLPEDGIELAQQSAEKFFDGLDPKEDALFFASSDQVRALETANIYRKEAIKRGFRIIAPENVKSKQAQQIGEGEIREVRGLSLRIKDVLAQSVFNTHITAEDINWSKVDPDVRSKWEHAREIISENDYGSWGENFFYHSEKIQEIFPILTTSRNQYEREFKNLLKLVKFADEKIRDNEGDKNIKVLGFGHENYVGYALDKYFNDNAIGNCESVSFDVEGDSVTLERRGEVREVE